MSHYMRCIFEIKNLRYKTLLFIFINYLNLNIIIYFYPQSPTVLKCSYTAKDAIYQYMQTFSLSVSRINLREISKNYPHLPLTNNLLSITKNYIVFIDAALQR